MWFLFVCFFLSFLNRHLWGPSPISGSGRFKNYFKSEIKTQPWSDAAKQSLIFMPKDKVNLFHFHT